ncbi:MAG: thioredoxin domain-containing protein [Patescibacteria group bacterium]
MNKSILLKTWLPILGFIAGTVLIMVLLISPQSQSGASILLASSDQISGNPEAKTVLIEYSDFQCPACRVFEPTLKTLREENTDKLQFAYRHFPLKTIHSRAELAARASEAAGKQDAFWKMHDLIFDRQSEWAQAGNEETFINYARELGLNAEQFGSDLKSSAVQAEVDQDYQSGQDAGVNSTPTFFLNGKKMQFRTIDEFLAIVNQTIGE